MSYEKYPVKINDKKYYEETSGVIIQNREHKSYKLLRNQASSRKSYGKTIKTHLNRENFPLKRKSNF